MIRETKAKIHFTPYIIKKGRAEKDVTEKSPVASVSVKYGRLNFTSHAIKEIGMAGKWVKLYYEPHRKIIGWRVKDKVENGELKTWKLCQPDKNNGTWGMSITKMLTEFKGLTQESYLNLEIQKYKDIGGGHLNQYAGETFFFIEVKGKAMTPVAHLQQEQNKYDEEVTEAKALVDEQLLHAK